MSLKLGDCLLLDRLKNVGMTQAEFARRMGVSPQYVSKLIKGTRKMSLEFAFNASQLLGCRITDLYIVEVVRDRS